MKYMNQLVRYALTIIGIFTFLIVQAQEINVSGTVTDNNGEALIGASIIIKGTTKGTITDIDGNFSLTTNKEDVLVFSFVGYINKEVTVGDQVIINTILDEDIESLEEIIVIGYGTQKKEDKTGAVSTVGAKDFNQGAITSAEELITGKIAGVQITTDGGAPGSGSTIRVRGGSSLNANNDPLIIIDGIPIDNEDVSGMRNPLNTVNPNDIETFTVLKDASATAIYGSRASNGVIIINTKKGEAGKMKVDYQGSFSLNTVTETAGVLNANVYRSTINNNFPLNADLMGTASTKWNDEIFNNSMSTAHNLAISGKKGILPYRASLGYNKDNGILKTSSLDRITASLNLNPTFFDDKLMVSANAKYMNIENRFADEAAIGSALTMDPTQKPFDAAEYEEYGGYFAWTDGGGPISIAPGNPLAQLEQKNNTANVHRFIGNVQFEYKLHFLPELKTVLNLGTDYSTSEGKETIDALAAWDAAAFLRGGDVHDYNQKKRNELLDFYLNYDKELPALNSRLNVLGGYSWQHFWDEEDNFTYFNIPNNEGSVIRNPYKLERTEHYLLSFFSRLNYTLADKYIVTGTIRYDGSSKFLGKNKWGLFPSTALAWKIHKENFLSNFKDLSELKLRIGYGVTGQQDILEKSYPALGIYTISQSTAGYRYINNSSGSYENLDVLAYRPDEYDESIQWEETTTFNLGLDYGFYNNRISGSLEGYYRTTKNLINEVNIAAGSNFRNKVITNVGNTENKGVELSLLARAISRPDFIWRIGVNGSYNDVKVTKLIIVDDPDYIGVFPDEGSIEGGTGNTVLIHQEGKTPNSFFVYKQLYDANGNPLEDEYADLSGDGKVDSDDLRTYKSSAPKYAYGINSSITYKKWDFSFAGHGSIGNYVYNNVASNGAYTDKLVTNGQFLNNLTDDIYNTNFQKPRYLSDYYVQDASFFRLDNVLLGYNFDPIKFKDIKFRVYATINNVFVITKYEGLDPEVFDGMDNNIYPRPRTFLLGVNMSF